MTQSFLSVDIAVRRLIIDNVSGSQKCIPHPAAGNLSRCYCHGHTSN